MIFRRILILSLLALASPALAQSDYPNKSVTLVIPVPPGGASDFVTPARPEAQRRARSDRGDQQPRRRRRHHRVGRRRQGRSRRLHADARVDHHARHRPASLHRPLLRLAEGLCADRVRRQPAADHDGQQHGPCEIRGRRDRARQGAAGHARLRVVGQRRRTAPRRRIVQAHDRDRSHPRALPRQRPCRGRRHGRTHRHHVRRRARASARHHGRQAAPSCGGERAAQCAAARHPDLCRARLFRHGHRALVRRRRPPARRRPFCSGSMPSSQKFSPRPRFAQVSPSRAPTRAAAAATTSPPSCATNMRAGARW